MKAPWCRFPGRCRSYHRGVYFFSRCTQPSNMTPERSRSRARSVRLASRYWFTTGESIKAPLPHTNQPRHESSVGPLSGSMQESPSGCFFFSRCTQPSNMNPEQSRSRARRVRSASRYSFTTGESNKAPLPHTNQLRHDSSVVLLSGSMQELPSGCFFFLVAPNLRT